VTTVEHSGWASPYQAQAALPSKPTGSPAPFSTASYSKVALAVMQQNAFRRNELHRGTCAVGTQGTAGANPVHGQSTNAGGSRSAAWGHYIGRSVGSGQCVSLIHAVNPGIGLTSSWACGEPVQGNKSLTPGTVIATFQSQGRYANATDGSSHAAIYVGQNEQGIQVFDQWAGRPAAVRTIRWTNPGGPAADTGSAFHVVRKV
jgi:hypothetical protein